MNDKKAIPWSVPPGVSGSTINFNASNVPADIVASEVALLNLGDFEALNYKIDLNLFKKEIHKYKSDWVDYLPRTDRPNNRKCLALTNLPGKTHRDNPSLPQASFEARRTVREGEFNQKTEVYESCTSLHELLNDFQPLGRSFLVQCNIGGYFVPHRDHPTMPRDSFRIVVFLNNCNPMEYDWIMETDKKLSIEMGRAYYVNTRKVHRTMSWVNNSIHLIMNVPCTPGNVSKVLEHIQHRH